MGILFLILAIVFFVLWTKEKKSSKEKIRPNGRFFVQSQ